MKKTLIKAMLLSAFFGVFFALGYLGSNKDLYASNIILKYAFTNHAFLYTDVIYICTEMIPYFTFMFIFGTYIYEHFNTASTYYFSRCTNRGRWFCKEMLKLFFITLIFTVTMPLFGIGLAAINNHIIFDMASLWIYIYYIAIYTLFLFTCTIAINILAIKKGSMIGFSTVAVILLVLISLFALWNDAGIFTLQLTENPYLSRNTKFLMLNLVAHLILPWHSSSNTIIDSRINYLNLDFDLNISLLLFFVISVITVIVSTILVKKQDLIVTIKQMEY